MEKQILAPENVKLDNLKIISAGAGSGKTFRLMQELVRLIKGGLNAKGIIATTFTQKAAAELQERVSTELISEGLFEQAAELPNALIGTVHSLGVKLLQRFAYEAGVSPDLQIMPDTDQQLIFNQSLATVLTEEKVNHIGHLSRQLGFYQQSQSEFDWRREVKTLIDIARVNDFSAEVLEASKKKSFETLAAYLHEPDTEFGNQAADKLKQILQVTLEELEAGADETKTTADAKNELKNTVRELEYSSELIWEKWVRLVKLKTGARSRDAVQDLVDFAARHESHPQFHADIRDYIYAIFDVAIDAIREYEDYKRKRGLIDYTDMEVKVRHLLAIPSVKAVLAEEIELLMVDEFQDTSPIQLEIFLSLSKIARHSVWVGDPKQSIYGFRGADPKLMQAIIEASGGIKPENIQPFSWRSREDLVYLNNAFFCRAFDFLPEDQIALQPKRKKIADGESVNQINEAIQLDVAIQHWHFQHEGTRKVPPGKPWMENCVAITLKTRLEEGLYIPGNPEGTARKARASDVAILCRSNKECEEMAKAVELAGMKAIISGKGLLESAEAKLLLACLKYLLSPKDELSIAEILYLGNGHKLEDIVLDRLDFLQRSKDHPDLRENWGENYPIIRQLQELAPRVQELSCSETLSFVVERLRLEHLSLQWGNKTKRLANIDELRRLSGVYEDNCLNSHSPATLGGFLLWLYDLHKAQLDIQGTDQDPNAVQIMTYHKSKGLEWPVTICASLENGLRNNFSDLKIVPEQETVDLDNILGNRWLRFWINPYGSSRLKTPLKERIESSETFRDDTREVLLEEARLLYVGLTRARDILIFPTRNAPTKWLNRVFHKGDESKPLLDELTEDTNLNWKNQILRKSTLVQTLPNVFARESTAQETITHLARPRGMSMAQPKFIDLRQENWDRQLQITLGDPIAYLRTRPDEQYALVLPNLSAALKAFLRADYPLYEAGHREKIAREIVSRFDSGTAPAPHQLIEWNDHWFAFLQSHFPEGQQYRNLPLRYTRDNRNFTATLDQLIETGNEIILLQQSSFSGNPEKTAQKSKNLASWMHFAASGIQEKYPDARVRTFAHYFNAGILQEILIENTQNS